MFVEPVAMLKFSLRSALIGRIFETISDSTVPRELCRQRRRCPCPFEGDYDVHRALVDSGKETWRKRASKQFGRPAVTHEDSGAKKAAKLAETKA